ncbi:MAG: hypothetical protein JOY99_09645 [Sphingomonadaceae bacterium]|nr:hypothetical protein [Sphingomonadaceae bacterium]
MAEPIVELVDEQGMLLRDAGGFYLKRDSGGIWRLELARTPVDLVEKRVRLIGERIGEALVQAEGVQPA